MVAEAGDAHQAFWFEFPAAIPRGPQLPASFTALWDSKHLMTHVDDGSIRS
jgi:hypothetical protein